MTWRWSPRSPITSRLCTPVRLSSRRPPRSCSNPIHEYTRGLLGSVLSIESGSGRLHQVPGAVPSPRDFPKGDRFAPRSSHPHIGLDTRPVFKRVPGTEHFYSELPDEVLKANGLTPHAEVM